MAFSLKDFTDVKKIGEGGMGNVYLATQVSLGRRVVIKELAVGRHDDPAFIKRFKNEAKAAAALDHENIIQIFDFGEDSGSFYILMEFIDGWDLERLLQWDPFPKEIGLIILFKALKGLKYAHGRCMTHCDVKPGNILVSKAGKVKVVDFGLAHAFSQADSMDPSSLFITPAYMPPEIASGGKIQGFAMDMWSAGVVAYRIVTGRFPFTGDSRRSVVYSIVNKKETDVLELCPTLPGDIADSIRDCLQKDPRKRPASFDETIGSIGDYLYELGVRDIERMLVEYIHDKNRVADELDGLLGRYSLNKDGDRLTPGVTVEPEGQSQPTELSDDADMPDTRPADPFLKQLRMLDTSKKDNRAASFAAGILSRFFGSKSMLIKASIVVAVMICVVFLGIRVGRMIAQKQNADLTANLMTFKHVAPEDVTPQKRTQSVTPKEPIKEKPIAPPPKPALPAAPVNEQPPKTTAAPGPVDVGKTEARRPDAGAGSARKPEARKSEPDAGVPVVKHEEGAGGILMLTINPLQAHVELDGTVFSAKDATAGKRVSAGTHTISARAIGYEPFNIAISIEANSIKAIPVFLTRLVKDTAAPDSASKP
jgi:serine/threonine protein kinase